MSVRICDFVLVGSIKVSPAARVLTVVLVGKHFKLFYDQLADNKMVFFSFLHCCVLLCFQTRPI